MEEGLRRDAEYIIRKTIEDVMPERAVKEELKKLDLPGRIHVIAVGKAAWIMAKAAGELLQGKIEEGIVVTKYRHAKGDLPGFIILKAAHPVPDEQSILAADRVMDMVRGIRETDSVLFLISGGGSALLERPVEGLCLEDIRRLTEQLLACGAGIREINVIRKKLSAVKGGKLAGLLKTKRAHAILLSDIVGEGEDMIASGLTYPDQSSSQEACAILHKYGISPDAKLRAALAGSEPCRDVWVENHVVGSVENLCLSAASHAKELGYSAHLLTASLQCEARDAGRWLVSRMEDPAYQRPFALVAGGETVVHLSGKGLGGRNQELALSAAGFLEGKEHALLFSLGSDGTDGPTDAAGGMVDGSTAGRLRQQGIEISKVLEQNDSYHALERVDGLIFTGPTGTNVNDVAVLLCR